jgi:hypothetical protein
MEELMAQSKHRRGGKLRPRRPTPLGREEFHRHERILDQTTRSTKSGKAGGGISLRLPKPKPPRGGDE